MNDPIYPANVSNMQSIAYVYAIPYVWDEHLCVAHS